MSYDNLSEHPNYKKIIEAFDKDEEIMINLTVLTPREVTNLHLDVFDTFNVSNECYVFRDFNILQIYLEDSELFAEYCSEYESHLELVKKIDEVIGQQEEKNTESSKRKKYITEFHRLLDAWKQNMDTLMTIFCKSVVFPVSRV